MHGLARGAGFSVEVFQRGYSGGVWRTPNMGRGRGSIVAWSQLTCGHRRVVASPGAMAAAVALILAATGIYPDGLWDHSTKLTTKNFEPFIKENVDAGKTVFVRWIASAG
jgi:hypothetical protein